VRNGVGKRLLLNGSAVATCWVIGVGAGCWSLRDAVSWTLWAGGLQSAAGVGCRGVGRCYGRLRKAVEGGGSHWCDFLTIDWNMEASMRNDVQIRPHLA